MRRFFHNCIKMHKFLKSAISCSSGIDAATCPYNNAKIFCLMHFCTESNTFFISLARSLFILPDTLMMYQLSRLSYDLKYAQLRRCDRLFCLYCVFYYLYKDLIALMDSRFLIFIYIIQDQTDHLMKYSNFVLDMFTNAPFISFKILPTLAT